MSKPAFQGQNDAPAPAQGFNQSVHDNPTHGKYATPTPAPKKTTPFSGSGPTGDPRDMQSTPSHPQEGGVDNPRTGKAYRGHNEQFSEPGNDECMSGLPHKSDGTPRYDSQLSSPLATPSKVGKSKPINPKR